jgi:SAM-dependent methyltransferase
MTDGHTEDEAATLARILPLGTGDEVLDVGCGAGAVTCAIARRSRDVRVVGVDVDRRKIAAATAIARRLGLANVSFVHADVFDLGDDFHDRFDVVCSRYVLMHLRPRRRSVAYLEALRVTARRGAFIAVVEPDLDWGRLGSPAPPAPLHGVLRRLGPFARERGVHWRSGRDVGCHLAKAGYTRAVVRPLCVRRIRAGRPRRLASETTAHFVRLASAYLSERGESSALEPTTRLWGEWLHDTGTVIETPIVLGMARDAGY